MATSRYAPCTPGEFKGFDAQGQFDQVLTFLNVHNWIKDGRLDDNLRAFGIQRVAQQ